MNSVLGSVLAGRVRPIEYARVQPSMQSTLHVARRGDQSRKEYRKNPPLLPEVRARAG